MSSVERVYSLSMDQLATSFRNRGLYCQKTFFWKLNVIFIENLEVFVKKHAENPSPSQTCVMGPTVYNLTFKIHLKTTPLLCFHKLSSQYIYV